MSDGGRGPAAVAGEVGGGQDAERPRWREPRGLDGDADSRRVGHANARGGGRIRSAVVVPVGARVVRWGRARAAGDARQARRQRGDTKPERAGEDQSQAGRKPGPAQGVDGARHGIKSVATPGRAQVTTAAPPTCQASERTADWDNCRRSCILDTHSPYEQRWAEPFLAEPKAQNGGIFHSIAARTAGDPDAMGDAVRVAIWAVDRDQPVWKIRSMASLLDRGVGERSPAAPGFVSTIVPCIWPNYIGMRRPGSAGET